MSNVTEINYPKVSEQLKFRIEFSVQSTKAIGTGRVGYPRQNSKPQFIQQDAFPIVTQYQPDNTPYFVAPVMPISPRRLGPSLQDRLNRHRQPQQQTNSYEGKSNPSAASSENAQITVGF